MGTQLSTMIGLTPSVVLLVLSITTQSLGLSPVPCGLYPCETPVCCPSGELTLDVSGCCPVCAKAENELCGGPWNINGNCAKDLNCLRTCGCFTEVRTKNGVESKDCIFPFKFKGKTYASCTKDHTTNNKAWCATEVDSTGTVIEGKWGDCDASCFEGDSKEYCQQSELRWKNGRCIQRSVVEPELQLQIVRYK